MEKVPFNSVLITGGSSGIGFAIAQELARSGAFLAITGRDKGRLRQAESELSKAGANVTARVCDVTDSTAMSAFIDEIDSHTPLELVIANAGISGGSDSTSSNQDKARAIMQSNVIGVMNTVHPAIEKMRPRKQGQIAIVSSLAGFRGLPTAPAYSASKVAVKAWGDAIRPGLRSDGLSMSVIYPGFVKSRITDQNDFPMPFFMSAERAAKIIVKGLVAKKRTIAFPWQMVLMMKLLAALPAALFDRIMAKGPKKI